MRRNFQKCGTSSCRDDQRYYFIRNQESTCKSTIRIEKEDEKEGASMINVGVIDILLLLLILGGFEAVTVVNHHPDDEYVLEHEVLLEDALAEAKKLEIHSGPLPGCQTCIHSEMLYCSNGSVINDHCCCEGKTNEVFLFVEHSCRFGPEGCQVQAGNCAEYTRLRDCCCHSYLASVWKYRAIGAGLRTNANLMKFLSILTVLWLHLL